MPRPYGLWGFGTKPNHLLQFDYMKLGPIGISSVNVLMIQDDHSGYCWFFAFPDTKATNAVTAIFHWCAVFGVPRAFMSDGPTNC